MGFWIVRNDISKSKVDAIVNAANKELKKGGGVCGAIFKAAGASKLQEACQKLAPIETSKAVITDGFALKANYIIHVAGPIYHDYEPEEAERLLRESYRNALMMARECGCKSIAFPLLSAGIYGYPKLEALQIAISEIKEFLQNVDMDVLLVLYDEKSVSQAKELYGDLGIDMMESKEIDNIFNTEGSDD
ncbi:MAG TPA: RNase III inhibitor [Clostridiaceae bacterium]|nr:RNase III inhibitor [Clostridiaceae bacterium]